MNVFLILVLYVGNGAFAQSETDQLASKMNADKMERIRCGYSLMRLWTTEVAHSPFAATPLITDANGDGKLDVVAAALSEAQTVLDAETGKTLPNSRWPAQKLDSSILASPLQFDINGDGMLDILFVTTSGELLSYTSNGFLIQDKVFELRPAYVKKDWYMQVPYVKHGDINDYITSENQDHQNIQAKQFIPVDAHVLATPVIADLNNDNRLEEMVIPVSYYFDDEDYRLPDSLKGLGVTNQTQLDKFVASGLVFMNLTSLEVIRTVHLELTKKSSDFPAYVLFSPTVIDMDRNSGDLEVIIGTSAGNIYVIDFEGKHRKGFPYSQTTIHGQVTVADINKDETLEIIAIDTSGNVVCINEDGTLFWESEISGFSSPGSRLIDINGDSYLDVLITTNEGDVYALNGIDGTVLPKWPLKVGHPINSNILATRMSSKRQELDLVFLASDGALYIVSTDLTCQTHFSVGESSLVQILSHDLVSQSDGMEILISTNDGTLICMGTRDEVSDKFFDEDLYRTQLLMSLPAETKSPNDFTFQSSKIGIFVLEMSRTQPEVTGGQFDVEFQILDPSYKPPPHHQPEYTVKVYFGSHFLKKSVYDKPGQYLIMLPTWNQPSHGHVILVLTNKKGQIFQDMFSIRFNKLILEDLQWLLMAPFITMVIILLVNHGFPSKDLLPYTFETKIR